MNKILITALLIGGIAFAAAQTKLYGTLDMTSHKIVNVSAPSSNSDAATKSYVDTANSAKLSLSGGQMTGAITMPPYYSPSASQVTDKNYVDNADAASLSTAKAYSDTKLSLSGGTLTGDVNANNHRIINVRTIYRTDAASKEYVDTAVEQSPPYQWFALQKAGAYTPMARLSSTTNRYFTVDILRQFTGEITSYVENANALASKRWASRTWKQGQQIKVPFNISPYSGVSTNGTIVVASTDGRRLGNWGVTFPPTASAGYFCYVQPINGAYTAARINPSTDFNVTSHCATPKFRIGITNATLVSKSVKFTFTATRYATSTNIIAICSNPGAASWNTEWNGEIPGKECKWVDIWVTDVSGTLPDNAGFKVKIHVNPWGTSGSETVFGDIYRVEEEPEP